MRLLFFIFILVIFASCVAVKEPDFNGIQNVRLNKLDKKQSLITLELRYFNPNKKSGVLKKAEGEAWLDKTYLGHFTVTDAMTIPANANFIVPVQMNIEMKDIARYTISAFLNDSVMIDIKGKARVGRAGLYKTIPLSYHGMQNLQDLFK